MSIDIDSPYFIEQLQELEYYILSNMADQCNDEIAEMALQIIIDRSIDYRNTMIENDISNELVYIEQ